MSDSPAKATRTTCANDEDPAEGRTYRAEEMALDEVPFEDDGEGDSEYPIYPLLDDE